MAEAQRYELFLEYRSRAEKGAGIRNFECGEVFLCASDEEAKNRARVRMKRVFAKLPGAVSMSAKLKKGGADVAIFNILFTESPKTAG